MKQPEASKNARSKSQTASSPSSPRKASSKRSVKSSTRSPSSAVPTDAVVDEMMGYLLRRANNLYHQYWADNFTVPDGSLTSMQAGMLLAIKNWEPITQTAIAQRMKIKLPSALHSTNHLETCGYISRTSRTDDRRSYTLCLTDAGRAALEVVLALVPVRDAQLLSPLSPDERELLRSLLMRIIAADI